MDFPKLFEKYKKPESCITTRKSNVHLTAEEIVFSKHREKPYRLTPIIVTLYQGVITYIEIKKLIEMGLQLVRFRMSHVSQKDKLKLLSMLKSAQQWVCEKYDVSTWPIGVCIDIPNAAIRSGFFSKELKATRLWVHKGGIVTLTCSSKYCDKMNSKIIYMDDPYTFQIIKPGCEITMCGEGVKLKCTEIVDKKQVKCEITQEGHIVNNEFITLRGLRFKRPVLLPFDLDLLQVAAELNVDHITVYSVRRPLVVGRIKKVCQSLNFEPLVLSTICEQEGLDNFDEILEVSDGIILAREFLTHQLLNQYSLPAIQMQLNAKCKKVRKKLENVMDMVKGHRKGCFVESSFLRRLVTPSTSFTVGKPFFISGNILETTLQHGTVSSCDLSDITNAVLQGCGFMLRHYSHADNLIKAMQILDEVCKSVESSETDGRLWRIIEEYRMPIDAAQACIISCAFLVRQTNSLVVVLPTVSGRTAVELTRMAPHAIIITVSKKEAVATRLQLYRGIYSIIYDKPPKNNWHKEMEARIQCAVKYGTQRDILSYGNNYVILSKSGPTSAFPDNVSIWKVTSKENRKHEIKCDSYEHINRMSIDEAKHIIN